MGNEHFGTEDRINRPEIQEGIEKSNKLNMFPKFFILKEYCESQKVYICCFYKVTFREY